MRLTDDGIELPVIDITHPAFACELTREELAAVMEASVRGVEAAKKMTPEMMRAMAEKSILVRGTAQASGHLHERDDHISVQARTGEPRRRVRGADRSTGGRELDGMVIPVSDARCSARDRRWAGRKVWRRGAARCT